MYDRNDESIESKLRALSLKIRRTRRMRAIRAPTESPNNNGPLCHGALDGISLPLKLAFSSSTMSKPGVYYALGTMSSARARHCGATSGRPLRK